MHAINDTHDPALKSWVPSANDPATDFPIQNLPLVVFASKAEAGGQPHRHEDGTECNEEHIHPILGMAIGDQLVDLGMLLDAGMLNDPGKQEPPEDLSYALDDYAFNTLAAIEPAATHRLRAKVSAFLRDGPAGGQQSRRVRAKCLTPLADAVLLSPVIVGNYTDFYASIDHATNVGRMFRPDNPLLPNYKHVPIGYHGRASSIVPSDTPIRRPQGQQSPPDNEPNAGPKFGPCTMLDYELELGAVIAQGNPLGVPVPIDQAEEFMLGVCLVNDWSARDVQKWEYQPLGPFLAKNFATSVSPFIVTMEALAPFRCPAFERPPEDPKPLPYLTGFADQKQGGIDLTMEVLLESAKMRAAGQAPVRLSQGSFRRMYWTLAQLLAHHTSNGCNLVPGDLIASGTVSGPAETERGCLLELTWQGTGQPRKPITLPSGETRTFLADGDTVIMRAWASRDGYRRIGLGECRGTIVT